MKNNQLQNTNERRKFRFFSKVLILALVLLIGASASSAKGKKFGLLVGINDYPEGIPQLHGCINDVKNMRKTLIAKYGFLPANTTLLTDAQATRANIIAKIKTYGQAATAGDIFVLHYSGHGTLFPDAYSEDKDETKFIFMEYTDENGEKSVMYPRDKYDSAIVPFDANKKTSGKPWDNLILDDELYALFSGFTKKGVQVVFISDSCHSGSVARARKTTARVRTVPLTKVFGVKSFDDLKLKTPATSRTTTAPPNLGGLYITLTGAKDDEFSLDASDGSVPMGLFTSILLRNLNRPDAAALTYKQLVDAVSQQVSKASKDLENDQNPQLDARFGNPSAKVFSLPRASAPTGKNK